jgi:putative nucleotidyltransferase with HDIG domain
MPDINDFIKTFDNYCDGFLKKTTSANTSENIQLKITHSKNVFHHCSKIAKSEKLSTEKKYIAEICGLFHDIGRFEQFTIYNTFRDDDSVYHGALGVKVLRKEKFLESLSANIQEIVLTAVYNHGLIEIPKNTKDDKLYFSKIVRDADKADIFRIVALYYHSTVPRNIALEYGLKDIPEISSKVFNQFRNCKMISKDNLETLNDFKLMQVAWIFDINFNYTIQYILKNKFIDSVLSSITDHRHKKEIKDIIQNQLFKKSIT